MSGQVHREEIEPGIVKLTLNQPARYNAISDTMWSALDSHFEAINSDNSLRCVILTGAGTDAFSTGADISEFEKNRANADLAREYGKRVHGVLHRITACQHPTIAQIRGLCVGGGLELAASCDLRNAASDSRFGIPIKRLGLVVAYPELRSLIDLVGHANSLEILLEGRLIDVDRALEMGLINRAYAIDELDEQTLASARAIAEGAPLVARWHKKFARRLLDPTPLSNAELDEGFACFDTEDFQIGYQSFLSKSKPRFLGR